jgi:beta-xylosidase
MILIKNCVLFLLGALLSVSLAINAQNIDVKNQKKVFRYTNPITRDSSISMRDHCIIKVGEKWYCTGTSNPIWEGHNPGVRLLVSDDLINWKQHSWIIDASKLPDDCPYNGRFWAPEIHFIKGKYWRL